MERPSIWDRLGVYAQEGRGPLTQERLAELVGQALVDQYVYLEFTLAYNSIKTGSMIRTNEFPEDKESLATFRTRIGELNKRNINTIWDADDLTFVIEDPNKRTELKINALHSARRFWEDKLKEPDRSYDISILGPRRILAIDQKKQELQSPKQAPS